MTRARPKKATRRLEEPWNRLPMHRFSR
jgi:hypothetical protein